jgi:hypothetical protein
MSDVLLVSHLPAPEDSLWRFFVSGQNYAIIVPLHVGARQLGDTSFCPDKYAPNCLALTRSQEEQ